MNTTTFLLNPTPETLNRVVSVNSQALKQRYQAKCSIWYCGSLEYSKNEKNKGATPRDIRYVSSITVHNSFAVMR